MKRNTILHGISAIGSALVYAFFALPYYTIKTTILTKTETDVTSGYAFLKNALETENGSSEGAFAAAIGIILLIVAGIAFICSVAALLGDLKVIKDKKVVSLVNWIAFGATALLALTAILNLIANNVLMGSDEFRIVVDLGAKLIAGWGLTIVTTVLGLCAAGASGFAKLKK